MQFADFSSWISFVVETVPGPREFVAQSVGISQGALENWRKSEGMPAWENTVAAIPLLADLVSFPRKRALELAHLPPDLAHRIGRLPAIYSGIDTWLPDSLAITHHTSADVEDTIGCSIGTVSKWRRGVTTPNLTHCQALAEFFRVPASGVYVLAGHHQQGGLPPRAERGTCDDCQWIAQCSADQWRGLPIWCEVITPDDITAAWLHGRLDALLARYPDDFLETINV